LIINRDRLTVSHTVTTVGLAVTTTNRSINHGAERGPGITHSRSTTIIVEIAKFTRTAIAIGRTRIATRGVGAFPFSRYRDGLSVSVTGATVGLAIAATHRLIDRSANFRHSFARPTSVAVEIEVAKVSRSAVCVLGAGLAADGANKKGGDDQ